MDGTPKYSKVNQNVLADFALTMQESPNLTEKEILSKFPEFDNDVNAIHSALDYVATVQGGIPKDIATKFPEFDFGGTTPDLKKKGSTVSPVGGGSSGLLSVKFGGEDYEVNPTTQQVFKAGKPVTVPQHIKDYIGKNLGVPTGNKGAFQQGLLDRQQVAIDVATSPAVIQTTKDLLQPIGEDLTAVSTVDQPQVQQAQTKLKGYADVKPNATGMDIVAGVEKKLKSGEAVDLGGTIRFEKPEEKALVDRITSLDKTAKDLGVTRQQLTAIVKDHAAEQFLGADEQALYKIDKEFEKVAKTATPEQLKKYQEDRNKAKDIVFNTFDKNIKYLSEKIAKGKLDGLDMSKEQAEKDRLTSQYNNLLKTPQQIVDKTLKANPALTRLDKVLEGKTPQQKLDIMYDALAVEYYQLGKKLGYDTKDITEGKVGLKTFFGVGDLMGDVTGEDRKRYVDLRGQLKALAPAVLINRSPSGKQDNFFDTFTQAFVSQITPVGGMESETLQQQAGRISNFLNQAKVEISPEAKAKLDKSLEEYGIGATAGQILGGTAGIVLPAMLGGAAVGAGIRGLSASRYTAPIADFFTTTKTGNIIRGGLEYTAGGTLVPAAKGELDFGSGAVGAIADMLAPKFKFLAPTLKKVFGDGAERAAKAIGSFVAKGVGEINQETAQTLYQIYRDTPEAEDVFDRIKQQFGYLSEALEFAISTFLMGGAMGGGADIGFHNVNKEAVGNLTPQERAVYDTFTGEQRAKANQDIINIAKEQVSKVPTDNLQVQADNAQEAIDKLTTLPEGEPYSVEIDGIKYEGTNSDDLQSDIGYLQNLNSIINDELYKRNTGQTQTPPIAEADQTDVELAKPEAGVSVEGEVAPEPKGDIQTKQKETEAKIKRKDLFADGGTFANQLGGSGENSVPTNHREVNGIEFVEFSNPTTGIVDVVMTGTSDTDYVGYYRIYENGKPTNKWSSKFENQSRNKANFKTMISGAQEMLPQGHEYTEKTSISTDGLRVWGQQLERGYELQRDANGKLKTNRVAINGDAIENELGIPVNKGNFDNISVTNNADMKKVKAALLPYLQKFGLDENNIHFENGTVEIDLPVLKQTTTTQAAPTTTQESPINTANAPETTQNAQENGQQPHTAGYATIAADYLFTGGRDVILSTDYLLQAMIGSFQHAATAIDNIRNKYAAKLGNIKDDVGTDTYNKMMQEIRDAINNSYGNNADIEAIFDKILNSPTGFTFREGNALSQELDRLNDAYFSNNSAALETTEKMPQEGEVKETVQNAQESGQNDTNVTFEGKRGQADSISFDGKTIKQGEEIELNDVNISQDDSMPDLRSGKYKVRMLSVDANGKTATLTLTDGNEVITTTVKDLRKALPTPTTTTQTAPQEGVTEPTKAPVIKAQVVGTTAGLNTIIDGGLGKQQDPRFTGEVQQGKSIFKVNPNNNESSFLDISLPSSDSFGRSGGVQIRFELPNGVDANTVFEAVKKEAAKLGRLDAKDPDFKSKVQGLVDKGIAEIQGLATGGAKQAAQVKETVSEKQVSEPLKDVNSTAEAIKKLKVSDLPQDLVDTYVKGNSDGHVRIAKAYHKAKADKSNPDLVQAVEELLAPKGEVKAEPSVKAETPPTEKVEAEPTADIDNVADKAGIAPKKAKKAAIQSDVIDKLVGKATERKAAVENIADENIKEFAKAVTDTKVIDKVMDAIDNNDQLLADLEKKLGIKKICRI